MKHLRRLLIPAAGFAAAWVVATLVSGSLRQPPPPSEEPLATRSARERQVPHSNKANHQRIVQLARDFHIQPISEWNELWDAFARDTDMTTLKKLAEFPPTGRDACFVAERNILQVLSREELAVRTGRVEALAPEAFAALAEADPAAAWRDLERHYRADFAMAALRTLTPGDPATTLGRFLTLPPASEFKSEYSDDRAGENRSGIAHSPLGAIFGSWARRDPHAAADAAMKLPLRHRREAIGKLALTWAYHDGPAAIRFLLDSGSLNRGVFDHQVRLDVILRASFRTSPAATASLVAQHDILRETAGWALVVKPWYQADPEAMMAWIIEGETMPENFLSPQETLYNRSRAGNLSHRLEPEDAAVLVGKLAAAGSVSPEAAKDPDILLNSRDDEHPSAACDRWLAALRRERDPDKALVAVGMEKRQAVSLAVAAARVSPERAAELATLVPAAWLGPAPQYVDENHLARFWPELIRLSPARDSRESAFPISSFILDPAAAITDWKVSDPSPAEVERAVKLCAPYHPRAASDWVGRLPAGPARRHGEWLLAVNQARTDPEAPLRFLSENPGFEPLPTGVPEQPGLAGIADQGSQSVLSLCKTCLRLIRANGGDWQGWLARLPESIRNADDVFTSGSLAGDLAAEGAFLDKLSKQPTW